MVGAAEQRAKPEKELENARRQSLETGVQHATTSILIDCRDCESKQ